MLPPQWRRSKAEIVISFGFRRPFFQKLNNIDEPINYRIKSSKSRRERCRRQIAFLATMPLIPDPIGIFLCSKSDSASAHEIR